ncbi:hypothetical protein HIV01_015405 [Lysobacter arenosi]|uniref:Uncharacterized protein n=1 Tax=Lysobacter arenosi TaxID=2795387 RepID=A0ABX7RC65_9GAMM|nr:hypothetical protein [Lysobacter arenosi]QSX74549.1 hypothetical protein HIV01_015405 [Lysobacter arenosi]
MEFSFGIAAAFFSAQASAADLAPLNDEQLQAFVRMQALSDRCQKKLPGLKPQLLDARGKWLAVAYAAQLQAAEVYAKSKDGKRLAKDTDTSAFKAFDRNVLSAAATCIALLKDYDVAYPSPVATAVPADKVQWHLDNFAPMVLAALKCSRLDAIDVAPTPNGEETWTYRGCGRTELVRVAPAGEAWPMDGATADRLFAAMVD